MGPEEFGVDVLLIAGGKSARVGGRRGGVGVTAKAISRSAMRATALKLFGVAGVRGGVTLANAGLFAVIGAVFGADAVGRYAVYLAFVMIGGSLMAGGLPQMLMRRAAIPANHGTRLAARLRSAYWLGWLIVASLGTLLATPVFLWLNVATGLNAPLIAALGPAAYSGTMMVLEELRARARPEAALLCEHAPTTLAPFGAVAVSTLAGLSETVLVGALVSAHLLAAAFVCVAYLVTRGLRGGPREAARLLSAVSPSQLFTMAMMRFLAACSGYLAIPLVSIFAGPALAGLITVILKLVGLASTLSAIVNSVYASRFGAARRDKPRLMRLLLQTAILNGTGVIAVLAPMVAFPGQFLALFSIGAEMSGVEAALRIVAASVILRGFCGTPDLLFLVTGKAEVEILGLFASLVVLATAIAIAPASAVALAWAIAASQIVRLVMATAGILWVSSRLNSG